MQSLQIHDNDLVILGLLIPYNETQHAMQRYERSSKILAQSPEYSSERRTDNRSETDKSRVKASIYCTPRARIQPQPQTVRFVSASAPTTLQKMLLEYACHGDSNCQFDCEVIVIAGEFINHQITENPLRRRSSSRWYPQACKHPRAVFPSKRCSPFPIVVESGRMISPWHPSSL